MRRHICRVTTLLLGLALLMTGCTRPTDDLTGEWRSTGMDGKRFKLILEPDHTFHIASSGQASDLSKYCDLDMHWESDETKEPKRLILSATKGKDVMTIPAIYSLLDQDRLVLRFGLTPQGKRVAWKDLSWNLAGPGSKHILMERAPAAREAVAQLSYVVPKSGIRSTYGHSEQRCDPQSRISCHLEVAVRFSIGCRPSAIQRCAARARDTEFGTAIWRPMPLPGSHRQGRGLPPSPRGTRPRECLPHHSLCAERPRPGPCWPAESARFQSQ